MTVATVIFPPDEERRKNMRLAHSGVARDTDAVTHMRPDDFSSSRYGGIRQKSDGGEDPVVIMRSKETDPLRWKVVYGFSRVFFRSLAEAVKKATGSSAEIEWDSTKPDGTPRKLCDTSLIRSLGWSPKVGLTQGIRRSAAVLKSV